MKNFLKFVGFEALTFIVAWIIEIALTHLGLFDFIEIYFYKSIVILVVSAVIVIMAEVLTKKFWKKAFFDFKDIFISFLLIMCINTVVLSFAVVSLDRSLSVFILSYMNESEDGFSEEEIEEVFQDVFVEQYGMLDRRFWEQLESGNIVEENGKYKLTSRGEFFVDMFKLVGNIYDVDDRFINPTVE